MKRTAMIERLADILMDDLSLKDLAAIARNAQLDELYGMRDEELQELAEEILSAEDKIEFGVPDDSA